MTDEQKCKCCMYNGITGCDRTLNYQDCKFKPNYCAEIIIEELEKIKAEIERLKPNNPNFEHYVGETRAINNALEVIDNHIKELKGEQE